MHVSTYVQEFNNRWMVSGGPEVRGSGSAADRSVRDGKDSVRGAQG